MKRLLTNLFVSFFFVIGAIAQTTYTVSSTDGAYSGTGTYCTSWTSTTDTYPVTTISVGANNLVVSPATAGTFELHEGSSGCTYSLSVSGCRILSYHFTYKTKSTDNNVTITIGSDTYTSSDTEQTLPEIEVNANTATFKLNGNNKGVIVTGLTLTVEELFKEGNVIHLQNVAFPARAVTAVEGEENLATLNVAATDNADTKQQWLIGKSGEYYTFRNLYNGRYISQTASGTWGLTDTNDAASNLFEYVAAGTANSIRSSAVSDGNGYMHIPNATQSNIQGWSSGAGGSQWTITLAEYTEEQITELIDEAEKTFPTLASYQRKLEVLFTDGDGACLTPAFDTLDEAKANSAYSGLSADLQAIVDKVYNDAWAEDNADADKQTEGLGWDASYAKRFRVQMYEPYSIAGDITGFLRMNAHANNDNPTGIYVHEPCNIYVMVDGEIKDGATLRLIDDIYGNGRITNATGDGHALKPGLNIIPFTASSGHLYICYNVDTYNPDGETVEDKFPHKLSEYEPLKIHIEGGAINGFYNACGDVRASARGAEDDLWYQYSGASYDNDADWEYMEVRANLSVLPIVSNRQVMLFQLEDVGENKGMKTLLPESVTVPTVPNYYTAGTPTWDDYGMGCNPETGKINIWMETWDRIMYAELATLGLIQKSEVDKMNQFYPRWNADGTRGEIYDYNNAGPDGKTYFEFCNNVDYSELFNHHGVSLGTESGFMSAGWHAANYNINTLSSLVTMAGNNTDGVNNYAVDIWGPAHEIGHQFQDVFNIRGGTEVTNNVFSNAAVWYQGAQTSRYNWGGLDSALSSFNSGTPFIDYNIWAMTQMFYKLWLYYHLAGNNTQFYPRFFEMLRVDPLNAKGATATGTDSMLKIYEKMCDAAGEDLTEFFRAHGFFVLLDNYPKGDYGTTIFTQTQEEVDAAIERVKAKYDKENYAILLINDLTTEILCHDGVNKRKRFDNTPASEYGTVDKFINGTATEGGEYTASVNSDGTITMSGDDSGIGFIILDETGKLVSFSYNSTFELGDEALETIMTGNATFLSVGADVDAEPVAVAVDLSAMQKEILGTLIDKVQPYVDKIDNTYTRIGFYKAAALAELVSALECAKETYAGTSGYEAAYDLLYDEYHKVLANNDAKIPLNTSLAYIITNKEYSNQTIWVNSDSTVRSEGGVDTTLVAAKWQFKETATSGVYNIYNMSGLYCPAVEQSTAMKATETPDDDALYTLQEVEDGVWAIKFSPAASHRNFHSSGNNVVGWSTDNNASRWYLTAVAADPVLADLTNLEVAINKTQALVDEVVGETTYTRGDSLALTTTVGSQYYIWSNAADSTHNNSASVGVDKLIDGAVDNHFHTEWSSEPTSGSHYIAVDLGENTTLPRFSFSHTTRPGASSDFPKSVDIYGSDDNVTYKFIGSVSGMPQTAGTAWTYDGIMVSSHRYLRFNYHANRGYWHMAEFDIMPVTGFSATVNNVFSEYVEATVLESAIDALLNAKQTVSSMSPQTDEVNEKCEALETAYEALKTQYESIITLRKDSLARLAAKTDSLINLVGEAEFSIETPFELTTSNLYCNAAMSSDGGATQSNKYNLDDDDSSTYLHTNNGNTSEDGLNHYLRVDLGEGKSTKRFKFNYQNRTPSSYAVFPKVLYIQGSTDGEAYDSIIQISSGLPNAAGGTYESSVLGNGNAYRYIRFMVNSTYAGKSTPNYFCMAEFGLSTISEEVVTVYDAYSANVTGDVLLSSIHVTNSSKAISSNELVTSVPFLDAQIADQQAAYDRLYAAKNNVSALKANLLALIQDAQALYDEMSTDGEVNGYYSTSELTNENLSGVSIAIIDAQTVHDADAVTIEEITTAYNALNEKYYVLKAVKEKDITAREELTNLITEIEDLFTQTTVNGVVPVENGEIALQATDETRPYYIWSNAPAHDCNSYSNKIQGLIDDNDDGSANNTGTFFGTAWNSGVVDPYTHYIEIDLGAANTVLESFAIDYTTRNSSSYSNQYPDGLKFLGSNDKVNYEEFYSVTEGLATGACEQWTMPMFDIPNGYRYIRIAVSTEVGYFNMSDFNLYSHCTTVVNENYSTSDIFACLPAAMRAYCDAKAANAVYLQQTEYDAAKTALQEQIDAMQSVIDANVDDRTSLTDLADEIQTIVEELASIVETDETITLQAADDGQPYYIWSNAPHAGSSVANLLDTNNNTTFHSRWDGDAVNDYHYLAVDFGENYSIGEFTFNYTTVATTWSYCPTAITIQASNDFVEFTDIASLTSSDDDNPLLNTNAAEDYVSNILNPNGNYYRYLRFVVKENKYGKKFNGYPYFQLATFGLTSKSKVEIKDSYKSPEITIDLIFATLDEIEDAGTIANRFYVSPKDYEDAINKLQATKDAILAVVVSDKTELENLIADTEAIIGEIATVNEIGEGTQITMQCVDANADYYLYCNAAGTNNSGSGDKAGVAALVGDNLENETYLHTTYGDKEQDDNLDHYLRLDMGESKAMESFKFSYTGRVNNNNNAPTTMIIEGSNNLIDFEPICTLTGLPISDATVSYESETLGNGKAYRYIRFMVTETKNGATNNGHPFFVLSQFSVTAYKTVELSTDYVFPDLPLSTFVAYNEVADAKVIKEPLYIIKSKYDTALDELQVAYDELVVAKNSKGGPVKLTTDVANPILYKIKINRDGDKVLSHDGATDATKMVAVADESLGDEYQAWYFMQGGDDEATNDVYIYPYWSDGAKNTTLRLAAYKTIAVGNSKVKAVSDGDTDYTMPTWYMAQNGDWWNIQPEGKTTYFSNHGGVLNKMGFLNQAGDGGSQFQFVLDETDYSLSDAYFALYNQHATYGRLEPGTAIGTYTETTVDAFNAEYDKVAAMLEAKSATDDEYNAACEALVAAYGALRLNMPSPDKFYALRCNYENRYIYVGESNQMQWADSSYDKKQSRAIWVFEDVDDETATCNMKSLHTGGYLATIATGQQILGSEAAAVKISPSPYVEGAVVFTTEGNEVLGLHANGYGDNSSKVVIAQNNEAASNHYFFEEIEPGEIHHSITMNATFSTLMLNYNVIMPAGVEAYDATSINGSGSHIILETIAAEGEVLPANVPVILYRTDDATSKSFNYTTDEPLEEKTPYGLLHGSLCLKYVQCVNGNMYYKLMMKNDGNYDAKMYQMYKEYAADGTFGTDDEYLGTDNGGHIKCSANKIYMELPSTQASKSSYNIRFGFATDIDKVEENAAVESIYDLQGRKLNDIEHPGLYIINGKKVRVE